MIPYDIWKEIQKEEEEWMVRHRSDGKIESTDLLDVTALGRTQNVLPVISSTQKVHERTPETDQPGSDKKVSVEGPG